jgi:glycosyltransferase EpsD
MAGLPLLMTNCLGNREVVEPEVNGLLCPVDDVEDMARLLKILLSDVDLREKLARGSRERAYLYNWMKIAEAHLKAMQVVPIFGT